MTGSQPRDSAPELRALAVFDAAIDAALVHRVQLHDDRACSRIDVPTYLAGLKAVRDVEDALNPKRRVLGAEHGRAYDVTAQEAAAAVIPRQRRPVRETSSSRERERHRKTE